MDRSDKLLVMYIVMFVRNLILNTGELSDHLHQCVPASAHLHVMALLCERSPQTEKTSSASLWQRADKGGSHPLSLLRLLCHVSPRAPAVAVYSLTPPPHAGCPGGAVTG